MNENIDLTKILKDCPKGWKFYSSVYGEVVFVEILPNVQLCPVIFEEHDSIHGVSIAGEHFKGKGECTFFPSRDQRDGSKFTAPWYKKEKFGLKTLSPYDMVLVRDDYGEEWLCAIFSHIKEGVYPYNTASGCYSYCIPYNDKTKHLVGTTDGAPEYYRYWED